MYEVTASVRSPRKFCQ